MVSDGGWDGGWTRGRVAFLVVSAAAALTTLWVTSEVLLPFVLAVVIAYVLTPLVALCERVRVPRALAILLVYTLVLGGITLSVVGITPRVVEEGAKLRDDLPRAAKSAVETWGPPAEKWVRGVLPKTEAPPPGPPPPAFEVVQRADGSLEVEVRAGVEIQQHGPQSWRVMPVTQAPPQFSLTRLLDDGVEQTVEYVKRNAVDLLRVGQTIVARLSRGIFLLFMTLMVAGYLMYTREDVIGFFTSLPPPSARASFSRLLERIDRGLSGVVRGQLLICLVNGVLSAIGFWLFDLKYWPILSIIAGVGSLIPIFGSILSTIPAVAIGLTQGFSVALWVLLWILGIHQVEANFLNPKIIGTAAKIHPVLVVFALIAGEHFYGLSGALLAVPTMSLALSVFQHFRYESLPDMPPDSLLPVGDRPPPRA